MDFEERVRRSSAKEGDELDFPFPDPSGDWGLVNDFVGSCPNPKQRDTFVGGEGVVGGDSAGLDLDFGVPLGAGFYVELTHLVGSIGLIGKGD